MSQKQLHHGRRGAWLAGTAFTGVLMLAVTSHPQRALAACAGENTASVTCDAANPATAGTLNTSFAGTTLVNINAGAAINAGGASVSVLAPGSLTFNHNDAAGITAVGSDAVSLANPVGGVTYVGNADVISASGRGLVVTGGGAGDVLITNNATVAGANVGLLASRSGTGLIRVDGSGTISGGTGGILATHFGGGPGAGSNGIELSGSGTTVTTSGAAISAAIMNAVNASNVLVDRAGFIGGPQGIVASTDGTGHVTVAGNTTIASSGVAITARQTNNVLGTIGHVTVSGSGVINSSAGIGILAEVTGANNAGDVTVDRSGSITANSSAVIATNFGAGNVSVTGAGNVISTGAAGILGSTASGNVLIARSGTISSAGVGIFTSVGASGTSTVTVSGDVTSLGDDGVRTTTSAGTNTVTVTGGTIRSLLNGVTIQSGAGNINATIGPGAVIEAGTTGLALNGGTTNTVTNNGAIGGVIGLRTFGAGSTAIVNTGSITGTLGAIELGGAGNLFVMSGPGATLTGLATGSGSDTFRLAGAGSNTLDGSQIGAGWSLLDKTGGSTWTLTGFSTHTGAVTVSEGTLLVNGSLSSASGVTVASGATLGGNGALAATTIQAGGTLSPGNSIGTMFVRNNLTFAGGSNYVVEVSPVFSDFTGVTGAPGTATLAGTLHAIGTGGVYTVGKRYQVLNANGGVTGTFGNLAISGNFGFTRPHIEYDANNVYLVLDLVSVASFLAGGTPNQRAVAGAIDAAFVGGSTAAPFTALAGLSGAQLGNALDQLSGEVHASTVGILASDSLFLRSAILGRLRQSSHGGAPDGAGMDAMAALGLGGPQTAFADGAVASAFADARSPVIAKAPMPARHAAPDLVYWAQGIGAWGRFGGDGNAAGVRRDLAGFITGVDAGIAANGRIGIAAGYAASRNLLDGRGTSNVDTAQFAGYGGWRFGAINLRGGGAYAFHSIATDRVVNNPGFFDHTFANYNGHTGQVFGEVGYGLAFGRVALEPFVGGAWVRVRTDAAAERGGLAALNIAGTGFEVGYSTLGARTASMVPFVDGMVLMPRVTLAWQHAFNTLTPAATLAFQTAPTLFAISGVPIARDAWLAEAGLDLAISRHLTVGVSYTGQIGGGVADHAARGKFSWKF